MKRKDFGLIFALALLIYMAVASEKMILVTEGYAVSREVIEVGRKIYGDYCHSCHGKGLGGAPRIGDEEEWGMRVREGMNPLIASTVEDHRRQKFIPSPKNSDLNMEKIASAVAYLVRESGNR